MANGAGAGDFDVAVVGYGPVGMVTAALLARAGHSVVVLERYAGLYNLPRAAIFDDETMRTFARLGIAERLLPTVRVQPSYEWRNGSGDLLIRQEFAEVGHSGWAEWFMMYQPSLEDALDTVCQACPGVEVRLGSAVTGIVENTDGIVLTTVEGSRIVPRYVVACDGGNSFVRDALGIGHDDYGFTEPWMVCDFRLHRPAEEIGIPPALQLGDPSGPTSIISLGPNHHRVSFMLDTEEDFASQRAPEKVWARVADRIRPDDAELIRVATYTFRSLVAHRWRDGRVVLAGDAAHQMPPFLGQGMCSGIRDAQNLAFKLDLVLRGMLDDAVLDTYQTEREPHVRAVIEKGIELGRTHTIRDPERAGERDRVLLARRAAAQAPETIRFPGLGAGFFGTGGGALSVQGRVEARTAEGTRTGRLDQVVGAGFHLLVGEDALPTLDLDPLHAAGVHVVAFGRRPAASVVVDVDATYLRWFGELGVTAVAVRPDLYVFAAGTDPTSVATELLAAIAPDAAANRDTTTRH